MNPCLVGNILTVEHLPTQDFCRHIRDIAVYNPLSVSPGMDLIDPKELESMRHQLEDAQRWNASLQARLGAIQNRGGGVGGAKDGGKSGINTRVLFQSFGRGESFCYI